MARVVAVIAFACLALSACFDQQAPPPPRSPSQEAYHPVRPHARGGTLIFSDWEFPDSFNMVSATAETDLRIGALLYSPLWGLDSTLRPYPDLVREVPTVENGDVKVSPDGKSMTVDVKLVPGLHWSDGQPLTADDVIFTWQAICDTATQAAQTAGFDHIRSMTRRSATEVVWNFGPQPKGACGSPVAIPSGVYAPYLQLGPVLWLMPKHRLQNVSHANWVSDPYFGRPDVTSGPFAVSEIVPNDRITLVANRHYADGRSAPGAYTDSANHVRFTHLAYLDTLVYKIFGDKDSMISALRGGEVDLGFHLNTDDIPRLRGLSVSTTSSVGGLDDEFLAPNHGLNTATHRYPPWVTATGEDRPVLDALDLAVDRHDLVQRILNGSARVATQLYPSAISEYRAPNAPLLRFDLRRAQSLLDADGWTPGSDGVRVKNGHRLAFTLLTVCSSVERGKELYWLKQYWSKLGASVKTDCRKQGDFFGSFLDGGLNATGAFDMSLYSNAWQPDPSAWAAVGESSQIPTASNPLGENWDRCRDPLLDQSLSQGQSTLVQSQRRQAYLAAQDEWLTYHCTMPLFEDPQIVQVANSVRNFAPNVSISMDVWNAADWWIKS